MSIADEIQKLHALHSSGALTEAEFAKAKALILDGVLPAAVTVGGPEGETSGKGGLQCFAKSNTDQWIGGVCGGLGEHTPVPSWMWRIIFCCLALGYGGGLLLYVLLWIFAPSAASEAPGLDEAHNVCHYRSRPINPPDPGSTSTI